jgi:hypothetical protein
VLSKPALSIEKVSGCVTLSGLMVSDALKVIWVVKGGGVGFS